MIDTAEKRRSAAGVPFWVGLGVTPNVAKDAEWRQQAGWGYSGISAGEAQEDDDFVHCLPIQVTMGQLKSF